MNFKKALGFTAAVVMVSGIFAGCTKEATPDTAPETSVTKTETPQLNGYNLLWSDEFDGDTLNEENWNRELRDPGWTNNELQEYTDSDDNIFAFIADEIIDIKRVRIIKTSTRFTLITSLHICRGIHTVDGLSHDSGAGRLTHSSRSAKQECLCQCIGSDSIL